jgi:GT2 family glycosyltransferase
VRSVEDQTSPPAEVVVVIDHNDALLARAVADWPRHTVLPNRHRKGLSGARNTGVAAATGEVVAFLDDDACADPRWLERLCRHFADPVVGGVGGGIAPAWAEGAPRWFPKEFLWVVGCSYEGLPTEVAEVRNPIGANMAFRRALVVRAGGFAEEVGRVGTVPAGCEETELSIRLRAGGATILYDPDALVHHLVPADRGTLRYFRRRCFAEGRSKAVVARLADATSALATEREYARRTLPRGVARGLREAVRGPDRAAGAERAGAIPLGLACTVAGYVDGSVRRGGPAAATA